MRLENQIFVFGAVLFWSLAIDGAVQNYSPVPFWDMWVGYLDFYNKVESSDWTIWWSQHNEHRIILARFLFWIDIKWFEGSSLFLVSLNYIFLGSIVLLLYREMERSSN